MNKISTNQKTTRHKSQILDRVQSAGLEGIAIAPPAYGIDAIDNEASGAQISEILNSEAVAQRKAQVSGAESDGGTRTESSTGLPDALKKMIERLSGYSLDGVRVHYNSSRP